MGKLLEIKLGKDWDDGEVKGEGLSGVTNLRLAHCNDGHYWTAYIDLRNVRYATGIRDGLPDGTFYHVETWEAQPPGLVFDCVKVTGEIDFVATDIKPLPADTAVALRLYECPD